MTLPYQVNFRGFPACPCLATWLPWYEKYLQHLGLLKPGEQLHIYQLIGGAAQSNGTHEDGDDWDIAPASDFPAFQRAAAEMGSWLEPRTTSQGFSIDHGHGALNGCPHRSSAAASQDGELARGEDGLIDHHLDGHPAVTRTWQQGIEWAKAQMETPVTTVNMFDDVNVSLLPAGAGAYGVYANGPYANEEAVRAKFPQAHLVRIDVLNGHVGDCLDIERYDATNADAPGWFHAVSGHTSTPKPWLYTSASNVSALIAAMTAAGISREAYFVWSAHYTGTAHICSPSGCGFPQADGTQWTDKAEGRSLDESLISAAMLTAAPAPTPRPAPAPVMPAAVKTACENLVLRIKETTAADPDGRDCRIAYNALRGVKNTSLPVANPHPSQHTLNADAALAAAIPKTSPTDLWGNRMRIAYNALRGIH